MLLEAKLDPQLTEHLFRMKVTQPVTRPLGEESCPVHAKCDFCSNVNTDILCGDFKLNYEKGAHIHQPLEKYGAEVEYQCGPGRRFKTNNGSHDVFIESVVRTCDWEGNWQPEYNLPQCQCKFMNKYIYFLKIKMLIILLKINPFSQSPPALIRLFLPMGVIC